MFSSHLLGLFGVVGQGLGVGDHHKLLAAVLADSTLCFSDPT
jgi:hypothetical protein